MCVHRTNREFKPLIRLYLNKLIIKKGYFYTHSWRFLCTIIILSHVYFINFIFRKLKYSHQGFSIKLHNISTYYDPYARSICSQLIILLISFSKKTRKLLSNVKVAPKLYLNTETDWGWERRSEKKNQLFWSSSSLL